MIIGRNPNTRAMIIPGEIDRSLAAERENMVTVLIPKLIGVQSGYIQIEYPYSGRRTFVQYPWCQKVTIP